MILYFHTKYRTQSKGNFHYEIWKSAWPSDYRIAKPTKFIGTFLVWRVIDLE